MTPITVRKGSPAYVGVRVGVTGLVIAAALFLPHYYEPFRVNQFTKILIVAIAVLGLNLLTGFSGQISLGHSAFFGLGAYTTAILVADYGWPHAATVMVGAALAFAVGAACGLPALRIKGVYLALVTLALAIVFPLLLQRYDSVTGGSQGLRVEEIAAPENLDLANDQWRYYVALVVFVVLLVLVRNLVHGRVGRALIAIRDDETAAEVLGVNLALYKTTVFGVSAAIAAIAGSLFAMTDGFVASGTQFFNLIGAIEFLAATVIGGAATVIGPVFGAFFVEEFPRELANLSPELSQVLYGGLLIALMFVMPTGVIGLYRRVKAKVLVVEEAPRRPVATAGPLDAFAKD